MSAEWPTAWQLMPLQDVMEAIIDYRGKTPQKSESGIPLITAKIVKKGRIEEPSEFIPEDLYDEWMVRGLPEVGDVVITTEAPLGEVAQLNDSNVALAQRIVTLRGRKEVLNNDFLLYLMQSKFIQEQLEARASGSTVKGIKQSELRKVLLPLPTIDEQIEIAAHLKALDDKIELNRQINQTLEQIAWAIFKSWFVDFEPVKAKIEAKTAGRDPERAAMCAISGKLESELNHLPPEQYQQLAATAALFPDALVESELGLIPQGWEVGTLKDLTVKIGSGATPRGGSGVYLDEGTALIRSQNVYDSEFVWDGLVRISDSAAKQLGGVEVKQEDVLLNITGASILRTCVVVPDVLPARVNQHVAIIRSKLGIPSRYLHLHLLQQSTKDYLMGLNAGASREAVTKGHIESIPILKPSPEILACFDEATSSAFSEIEQLASQSRSIAALRDTLLPKLLSGELSMGEC